MDLPDDDLLTEALADGEDPNSLARQMRAAALDSVRSVQNRLPTPGGTRREETPSQPEPARKVSTKIPRIPSVRGFRLILALPHQFRPLISGQAFSTPAVFHGVSPDGRLRWKVADEGPVVVANLETDLEQFIDVAGVRLHWGDIVEAVVFSKCAGRIVATAVFSKARLGDRNQEEPLTLEIGGSEGNLLH